MHASSTCCHCRLNITHVYGANNVVIYHACIIQTMSTVMY